MDITFYKTKYSDNIPVIINYIMYDEHTNVIIFTGTYDITMSKIPQQLVMIQANKQYPKLVEVTDLIRKDTNIIILFIKVIQEIKSEAELSTWCITH